MGKNIEDIVMIDANAYCLVYQLKQAQVFAISIKNLEFQVEKKAKPETNPKTIIPEKYYDLLDMFSEKNSNILSFHWKYYYKITLKEEQKDGFTSLYKMSL